MALHDAAHPAQGLVEEVFRRLRGAIGMDGEDVEKPLRARIVERLQKSRVGTGQTAAAHEGIGIGGLDLLPRRAEHLQVGLGVTVRVVGAMVRLVPDLPRHDAAAIALGSRADECAPLAQMLRDGHSPSRSPVENGKKADALRPGGFEDAVVAREVQGRVGRRLAETPAKIEAGALQPCLPHPRERDVALLEVGRADMRRRAEKREGVRRRKRIRGGGAKENRTDRGTNGNHAYLMIITKPGS